MGFFDDISDIVGEFKELRDDVVGEIAGVKKDVTESVGDIRSGAKQVVHDAKDRAKKGFGDVIRPESDEVSRGAADPRGDEQQ